MLILVSNPAQADLTEELLEKGFGPQSVYKSSIDIEQCETRYAIIQMENCSGGVADLEFMLFNLSFSN